MSPSKFKTVRTVLFIVIGLAVVGAVVTLLLGDVFRTTPRAPALVTEAVYENTAIGLVFEVPDRWVASARSSAPPAEPFEKPHQYVRYQAPVGESAGTLELYAIDLPAGQDLIAYLSHGRNQIGSERWTLKDSPVPDTINGTPCTRYSLIEVKNPKRRRDIVAFDRGNGRIYAFLVTYAAGDSAANQAGRSIDSARWD